MKGNESGGTATNGLGFFVSLDSFLILGVNARI
jgi:hypothetical protein